MRTFNKTQEDRKILVNRIGELTGKKLTYTKMPRCTYEGYGFTVTKEGNLEVDDSADATIIETLITEGLIERPETPCLTVSLPIARHNAVTLRNLINLVFTRADLLNKALGTTLAVEKYGSSFFRNGAQPSGVLEHPGVLKNPEKIRENWSSVYGGANNAHKVAVLEEGMQYKAISLPPEDSQFLSTRQFGVNEICRIFRVPPHMVQDLEHATFSNIEHQSIDFVVHTLTPWLVRFEQAIVKDLLLPTEQEIYFPKFNVDGLLRGDYQSRMQGYATGISNGFLSPNDVRKLENQDLIPDEEGGNSYYLNGGYVRLSDAGKAVNPAENTPDNRRKK